MTAKGREPPSEPGTKRMICTTSLSSAGPGHDHIGLPSAAAGTDKLLSPIEDAGVGAVPSSHLGGIGLDLMQALSGAKPSATQGQRFRCHQPIDRYRNRRGPLPSSGTARAAPTRRRNSANEVVVVVWDQDPRSRN